MFAILFGLSMDYQVFLLTRIQEHYRETKDNHEAVVDGLAVSARVITSAALIMVSVYTSFILNGDPTVKQFGLGPGGGDRGRRDDRPLPARARGDGAAGARELVAAALGPARLPRVGIEGEEYFKARDAAAAAGGSQPPARASTRAAPRSPT